MFVYQLKNILWIWGNIKKAALKVILGCHSGGGRNPYQL
jgi:hypothetical protein